MGHHSTICIVGVRGYLVKFPSYDKCHQKRKIPKVAFIKSISVFLIKIADYLLMTVTVAV